MKSIKNFILEGANSSYNVSKFISGHTYIVYDGTSYQYVDADTCVDMCKDDEDCDPVAGPFAKIDDAMELCEYLNDYADNGDSALSKVPARWKTTVNKIVNRPEYSCRSKMKVVKSMVK